MNWRRFFDRDRMDAEQREELELYVEITAEEYAAQGMDLEEARRAARRKLGNATRIREEVYEMNTATFFEGIAREFRHAVRLLRLNPAFSITAILTLGLGIGATTAIFSVVYGVVIKPLPYPDSGRVVTVTHSPVFGNVRGNNFPFSPQMLAVYGANNQTFEQLGVWRTGRTTLTGMGDPEEAASLLVSEGTLRALHVQPLMGRWFSASDDQPGAAETAILTYGYWQRRLGGDPNVIGRTLTLDGRPRQIIGVMPEQFTMIARFDIVMPLQLDLANPTSAWEFSALARLKPGVTVAQANADIARMMPAYKERYVGTRLDSLHLLPAVRPFKEDVVGNIGQILWVLLGSIGILLLIACANVANLLLVRAEGRGQELAVRAALGAGRGQIAKALMVESLTLSLLGGAMGLALAYGGLRLLMWIASANLPRLNEIAIDSMVLMFTFGISLASGLLFGLVPAARQVGAKYTARLPEFLRGSGRSASAGKSQHRSQNALVVVQVALALVLLVGSGLMIRTFQNMRNVDPGFRQPESIQTLRISVPDAMMAEPERVVRWQGQIRDGLAAIPGVASAAYSIALPMQGGASNGIVYADNKTYAPGELPPVRNVNMVSPGFFATMGIRLLAGRDFYATELLNERNVVIVSEGFAKETWKSVAGAIGRRVRMGTATVWQEVVGVAADVYDNGTNQPPPPTIYWPAREHAFVAGNWNPFSVAFSLRSNRTGTESFFPEIRRAVAEVDSGVPVTQVQTLAEVYAASMARTSFSLVLLGIAGAMALLLGIVGIYGVLAYAVTQRQREVGIRLALGAQPRRVKRMFVYRGMILSLAGVVLGVGAAIGLTRLLASLLFGVKPVDPVTFAVAAGVLMVAALAASYVPAQRAAAVDPVETLRGQ